MNTQPNTGLAAISAAPSQEHHESDDRLQHGARDAEGGERGGTQVSDQCGVREQEERLDHESAEGRDREAQDLAVGGAHPPTVLSGVAVLSGVPASWGGRAEWSGRHRMDPVRNIQKFVNPA